MIDRVVDLSGAAVALHGYFLSDDVSMPAKHQLHDPLNELVVPELGHLVL